MERFRKSTIVFLMMAMGIGGFPGVGFAAGQLPFQPPPEGPPVERLELAGVAVIPHVNAPTVRFRRRPLAPLDARVQLFVGNGSLDASGAPVPFRMGRIAFNGLEAGDCLDGDFWSWHDTPDLWSPEERTIPFGALTVWTFNSVGELLGGGLRLEVGDMDRRTLKIAEFAVEKPLIWLSAVTFLGKMDNPFPDQMIFYLRNDSDRALEIADARLFLPKTSETRRWLFPRPGFGGKVRPFSPKGRIEPRELGGARVRTGFLPLTYTALEVKVRSDDGETLSIWAYLRIKKESFDISGGWVGGGTPKGKALTLEPYLKTLQRMHVNTGQIQDTSGYTDQTGPRGLYTRYPLKYFNRLWPLERYDNNAKLDRIHAVEFLGEPQLGTGSRPGSLSPQRVWEAFLPYSWSRLPTSLTLSESQNWHLYAGVSDYAHFDAYRVAAPSADSWMAYDRWGGEEEERIPWGAPLETIGDMTRSLRETSRPAPIAAWSQGAHAGWEEFGGRTRTSPTPDELRMQAYHALANRVTSLYWFNLNLKSLVKFRDLIEPITRIGREIRVFEPFFLEGTAYRYERIGSEGKLDGDLASIVAPMGALLFALDLDYEPDSEKKVFQFGPPRKARFEFDLPPWLRKPEDVFRFDADGARDVKFEITARGVSVEDEVSRVGIYVATPDPNLRESMERFLKSAMKFEESFLFDPAKEDLDFAVLKSLLAEE